MHTHVSHIHGASKLEARGLPAPIHKAYHRLGGPDALPESEQRLYSRMKYGFPEAAANIASRMADWLCADPQMAAFLQHPAGLCLAGSAFGSVPTASQAVTEALGQALAARGIHVTPVRFVRQGGFARMDYGALDRKGRRAAMRARAISLEPGAAEVLQDRPLLVVDDLRCTGAHEQVLWNLIQQHGHPAQTRFAYWISFDTALGKEMPQHEELLNHSDVQQLGHLLPLFQQAEQPPCINARLLKFILRHGEGAPTDLIGFFNGILPIYAQEIYAAASSADGYFRFPEFQAGYAILQQHLLRLNLLPSTHAKRPA